MLVVLVAVVEATLLDVDEAIAADQESTLAGAAAGDDNCLTRRGYMIFTDAAWDTKEEKVPAERVVVRHPGYTGDKLA